MTKPDAWRPISREQAAVVAAIVSAAANAHSGKLVDYLKNAMVSHATPWILDIRLSAATDAIDLPDGPLPARAYVPSLAAYQGEIVVWLTDGHVSGLEYAWITDDPPTRWPRPDEMEIVSQPDVRHPGRGCTAEAAPGRQTGRSRRCPTTYP